MTTLDKLVQGVISTFGHLGVPLFFMVSGFVLGYPFAQSAFASGKTVRLNKYFVRRLTRIEPPYLANILLLFGVMTAMNLPVAGGPGLWHLLSSLTYTHNIVFDASSTINYVAWSLEIEVQFYLLAPLLAAAFYRGTKFQRRLALMTAALLLWLVARMLLGDHPTWLIDFVHWFLGGMFFADLYVSDWSVPSSSTRAWDLTFLGSTLLLLTWGPSSGAWAPALGYLAVASLFAAALRGVVVQRLCSVPAIATIGGMCYTIYLWHSQTVSAFGRLTDRLTVGGSYTASLLLQCVLLLPMVMLVSVTLFLLIERPCMNPSWPTALARLVTGRRSAEVQT